ncbi:hypothetical protein [Methylocystis heyeri]|uniref:Uncharacterized protein n=1 Tax=Methylocystis heyeri TaxID=391905 RepID=A0A6B8KI96_9HYPH|nr:hypothetical protein [Methylocystis heyeri]QGM46751.1 hypothetical protein H2LOC_014190 [Methylocystis heyeri]
MSAMTVEMLLRLVDQFTAPMRAAESELKNFDKAAKDLGKSSGAGGAGPAVAWIEQQRQIEKAAKELDSYRKEVEKSESAMRAMADAAIARKLAHESVDLAMAGVKAGVEGAHTEVSLETQGNSAADIREIQAKAAELSRQFRAFDKTSIENMIADAKTFVGSLEHAYEAMPELLKLRTIQQGMHGHSSDKDFAYLAKALEQGGVANDPAKRAARVDTFARWMDVYRDTFSVDAINEFYSGLKGPIARTLSEDFLRGAGGHFIQEMGGHQAGNALSQMYMAIVAGRAQPRALASLNDLGLLDKDKIVEGGPFGVRAAQPGAVQGWRLFQSDPDKWITQVLGPALEKLSAERREEVEASLFSDATARNIADKLLNQQQIIQKDRNQIAASPGLAAAESWANKAPSMAVHAVTSQFENMLRDANKGVMPAATGFMNWLAQIESALSSVTERYPAGAAIAELSAAAAGLTASLKISMAAMTKARSWWTGESAAGAPAGVQAGSEYAEMVKEVAKGNGRIPAKLAAKILQGGPEAQSQLIKDAEAYAKGEGPIAAEAASVGRNLLKGLGKGLLMGVVSAAAEAGMEKVEEKAFGWTPESNAKARAAIEGKAHAFWRSHGVEMPWWEKEQPAGPAGGGGASAGAAAPKVDTGEIDQAKAKAEEAGPQIKAALDVTAKPTVDISSIEAAIGAADSLIAKLERAKTAARGAALEINRSAGSSGLGSLHDGTETH